MEPTADPAEQMAAAFAVAPEADAMVPMAPDLFRRRARGLSLTALEAWPSGDAPKVATVLVAVDPGSVVAALPPDAGLDRDIADDQGYPDQRSDDRSERGGHRRGQAADEARRPAATQRQRPRRGGEMPCRRRSISRRVASRCAARSPSPRWCSTAPSPAIIRRRSAASSTRTPTAILPASSPSLATAFPMSCANPTPWSAPRRSRRNARRQALAARGRQGDALSRLLGEAGLGAGDAPSCTSLASTPSTGRAAGATAPTLRNGAMRLRPPRRSRTCRLRTH